MFFKIKKRAIQSISIAVIAIASISTPSISSATDTILSKEDLLEKIETDGVQRQSSIWTKQPIQIYYQHQRIPAFTKITFVDANILPKIPSLENSQPVLVMIATVAGKEENLIISESQFYSKILAIDSNFYLQDPINIKKKWGSKVMSAISQQNVFIGMTSDQITASWGDPNNKNRSVGPWGTDEQWIYGEFPNSRYLYVRNRKLTGWQN